MSKGKFMLACLASSALITQSLCFAGAPSGGTTTTPDGFWHRKLPSSTRFTILAEFNNQAVRDNETGLVWEQAPMVNAMGWKDARLHCPNKNIGGRKGWRLRSFPELASLIDPTNSNPTLPTGHPFSNIQSARYWSATADAIDTMTIAWLVDFSFGVGTGGKEMIGGFTWCVRGPMNAQQY